MTGCDAELLAFAARWHRARRKRGKLLNAWRDAAMEHVPPTYRDRPLDDPGYSIEDAANDANVARLMVLAEAARDEMEAINRRMAETSARSLAGVIVKMKIAVGGSLPVGEGRKLLPRPSLFYSVFRDIEAFASNGPYNAGPMTKEIRNQMAEEAEQRADFKRRLVGNQFLNVASLELASREREPDPV